MTTPQPFSELACINEMLDSIGLSPAETLTDFTDAETEVAQRTLQRVVTGLCANTWDFNVEKGVTLTPDGSGNIAWLNNWARVELDDDVENYDGSPTGPRSGLLYDIKNKTNVWSRAVKARITYFLSYDDLPPVAKQWAAIRASRIFIQRMTENPALQHYTQDEEHRAYAELVSALGEDTDASYIDDDLSWRGVYKTRYYSP